MAYVWWAVRDSSIEDVVSRVFEPAGFVADPRWVSEYDLTDLERACFRVGEWTFALLRDKEQGLESAFAQFPGEVIQLVQSDFEWAIVSGHRAGETAWSVYGDQDHDFLRIDGAPPRTPAIDRLVGLDENLSEVPPQIARALTGFQYDASLDECPSPSRIVRLERTPFVLTDVNEELSAITVRPHGESAERVAFDLEVTGIDYADWEAIAHTGDRLLVNAGDLLAHVDASTFPPVLTALASESTSAAIAPWGNVLRAQKDDDSNTLVHELAGTRTLPIGLPFSSLQNCGALRAVADGVVAIPAAWSDGEKVPCLISAAGDRRVLTRIPVPDEIDENAEPPLVASFGDGSFLLTWNGEAYRWHRGALSQLGPLVADGDFPHGFTTAADGSIVGRFSHQFLKLWPDGRCERIAAFGDPLQVTRGPGDALIVVAPDDHGLVKVWWPAEQQVTAIPEELLEGGEHVFYFDARRELLVSISPHLIEGIPWRVIAALPRRAL